MTFTPSDLSCLSAIALIIFLCVGYLACKVAFWWGFSAGHAAGANEERSHANARVVAAKRFAYKEGMKHGRPERISNQ